MHPTPRGDEHRADGMAAQQRQGVRSEDQGRHFCHLSVSSPSLQASTEPLSITVVALETTIQACAGDVGLLEILVDFRSELLEVVNPALHKFRSRGGDKRRVPSQAAFFASLKDLQDAVGVVFETPTKLLGSADEIRSRSYLNGDVDYGGGESPSLLDRRCQTEFATHRCWFDGRGEQEAAREVLGRPEDDSRHLKLSERSGSRPSLLVHQRRIRSLEEGAASSSDIAFCRQYVFFCSPHIVDSSTQHCTGLMDHLRGLKLPSDTIKLVDGVPNFLSSSETAYLEDIVCIVRPFCARQVQSLR